MINDDTLRLIPCEGTGDEGGSIADMICQTPNDPNFIGGIPERCHACRGRRYLSYPELMKYREDREKWWNESGFGKYFKSKEFQEKIDKDIQELEERLWKD
jgi:hypothetical protein